MNSEVSGLISLGPIIARLGIMLAASLVVERFLAVINWIADCVIVVQNAMNWRGISDGEFRLRIIKQAVEDEKIITDKKNDSDNDAREIIPNTAKEGVLKHETRFDVNEIKTAETAANEQEYFAAQKEESNTKKEFWLQILGTFIAIACCNYFKFSIWDFAGFAGIDGFSGLWGFSLTGIIIGAGSKPVNFLVNFLTNRKIIRSREEEIKTLKQTAAEETAAVNANIKETELPVAGAIRPAAIRPGSIEEIVGFKYNGGDRPERLEYTHFFQKNKPIDLIVYHHTAMHSDSPFAEVVKEFDRKGWLTGYHCVVLKDGSINILCRWDRFGNHAYGYNDHSMGISMHGNFETDPNVPYSNYNGKYGIKYPTQEQIDATARIITLWNIYKLNTKKAVFPQKNNKRIYTGIVPHEHVKDKSCPGSNFPHSVLVDRVKYYNGLWANNSDFIGAIKEFVKIPMAV